MDDQIIIQHYWDRNEIALTETSEKYGSYCSSIAENIVNNAEDAQECVNDTYLKVWNEIPPQWPKVFQAFLGKIVRNLAYDCYRRKMQKSAAEDRFVQYLTNWQNVCRTNLLK